MNDAVLNNECLHSDPTDKPFKQRKPTSGSWKKGQSGNPLGRKVENRDFKALLQSQSEKDLETLNKLRDDPNTPHKTRLDAVKTKLSYAYGLPSSEHQRLNVNVSADAKDLQLLSRSSLLELASNEIIEGELT